MSQGIYFLNCRNDAGLARSAIAFYEDLGVNRNDNEQPKAFVYTDLAGHTGWESDQSQRATFADNVTVTWRIDRDAQSRNFADAVGSASNGFHNWTVHKDDQRFLFRNNDGFNCFPVYWAN